DRRLVIDVVGTFPQSVAHLWIIDSLEVATFEKLLATGGVDRQRRAFATNQIQQPHFFQLRVVEPKRSGAAAPTAEIKIGIGVLERVENHVVRSPILSRSHTEMVVV